MSKEPKLNRYYVEAGIVVIRGVMARNYGDATEDVKLQMYKLTEELKKKYPTLRFVTGDIKVERLIF